VLYHSIVNLVTSRHLVRVIFSYAHAGIFIAEVDLSAVRTWRLTCVCRTDLYESLRTCSPAVTCSILPYRACVKLTGTRGAGVKRHFCASCSTEHFVSHSSPSTWNYSLNTTTKQRRFAFGCKRTSLVKRDYTVRRYFRYRTWRRTTPTSCQAFGREGVQAVATFRHTGPSTTTCAVVSASWSRAPLHRFSLLRRHRRSSSREFVLTPLCRWLQDSRSRMLLFVCCYCRYVLVNYHHPRL